jgi:hypothetical protein
MGVSNLDMNTVTKLDTDDPTLVSRYLADQLSEAERTAFEAELVRRPERLQELEATARVKVGLMQLRKRGELEPLLRPARFVRAPIGIAVAAALTMFTVGVLLFRPGATPMMSPFMSSTMAPVIAAASSSLVDGDGRALNVSTVHVMFRSRAEGADATIRHAPSPSAVQLRVLPAQAEPPRYRATLSRLSDDGTATPVSSAENLQPAADGFVSVFADASRLQPGRYRLIVSAQKAASAEGDSFLIRVIP